MSSKTDSPPIIMIGIIGLLVVVLMFITHTVGELKKSKNKVNATAITEMVKEGYSPLEAGCAVYQNCSFKSNKGFEILKDMRINNKNVE